MWKVEKNPDLHIARRIYINEKTSAKRRYAARAGACTREEEKWKLAAGISDSISLRFNTQDKPSNAEEAHAGQCVAQLPTHSQSWQR
jgi:hypothetical protein